MPSDRTFVTELSTALGTLGDDDLGTALARRPPEMANLTSEDWDRMALLWDRRGYTDDFLAGFTNGRAFLAAPDALNGRHPRLVEWTGGRRSIGDEAVPADLRIDHVYLVSCKYLSRILLNPSPARLVDALLAQTPVGDARDWYQRVAPSEYQRLYEVCIAGLDRGSSDHISFPSRGEDLTGVQRRVLTRALRHGWPAGAEEHYFRLCEVVAGATARIWEQKIGERNSEVVLWRLLRIGSAPYFILGTSPSGSMRLRIDSPWDWRRTYRLRRFTVEPQPGGQPRVGWSADYEDRSTSDGRTVSGHVEIRWSHGRFAQPPEAKVYLDSPHEEVPGYHQLESQQLESQQLESQQLESQQLESQQLESQQLESQQLRAFGDHGNEPAARDGDPRQGRLWASS